MTPFLTDAEIDELCNGLTQPAARVRYLRSLGLTVKTKPNGQPIVGRDHFVLVMGGRPAPVEDRPRTRPNRAHVIAIR